MKTISVADYIVKELEKLGIKNFFGVPGDYNFNLIEAVENNFKTKWIGCTNELNAGYAADGYARCNGYGAIITTYNVGELSAINAIAGCFAENIPVINIVGVPKTKFIRDNAILHHNFYKPNYYTGFDAYSNVVQTAAFLNEDNAKEEIERILTIFIKEKKPVYIAIPQDICAILIENEPKLKEPTSNPKKLEKAVEHILKIIDKSENPTILGDILIDRFKAKEAFQRLVKNSGFPTSILPMGKGMINESERNFIGTYLGTLDNINVYNTLNNSDCVISIGTIFSDFNTMQFDIRFKPSNFVEIQGTYTIIECKVYEDILMKDIITALAEKISHQDLDIIKDTPELSSTEFTEEMPLNYDYMLARIQSFLNPNDCLISETGTFNFAALSLNLPDGCTLMTQLLWSSIGWATPALLGAMVAEPNKRMILLTGEGSHQQTFQEISNIVYKGLKPIIIVLNNSGYAIERSISQNPENSYNDVIPWDYSKLVDSFSEDVWTVKTRTNKEFDDALRLVTIKNKTKLCYIEAFTDKMDYPPLMKKISARRKTHNGKRN